MHAVPLDSVAHGWKEVLSAPQPMVSGKRRWSEPHWRMRLCFQRMGFLSAPPPLPNTPKIELINFFGKVGAAVRVKSFTPLCLAPGCVFSVPREALSTHFPFKWNLREQRILLII